MSDRPTLWRIADGQDPNWFGAFERRGIIEPASRADLLAALDVKWYCVYGDEECVPEQHDGCHWAVKP